MLERNWCTCRFRICPFQVRARLSALGCLRTHRTGRCQCQPTASPLLPVKPRKSPSATGQSRPTGGHHFLLTLNVFIAFQKPYACFETVNAI